MTEYYKPGIWHSEGNCTIGTETTMCLLMVANGVPVGHPKEFDAAGFYDSSHKIRDSSDDFIGADDDTYVGPLELIKWSK